MEITGSGEGTSKGGRDKTYSRWGKNPRGQKAGTLKKTDKLRG